MSVATEQFFPGEVVRCVASLPAGAGGGRGRLHANQIHKKVNLYAPRTSVGTVRSNYQGRVLANTNRNLFLTSRAYPETCFQFVTCSILNVSQNMLVSASNIKS